MKPASPPVDRPPAPGRRGAPRLSTRDLLVCAVLGAITAAAVIALAALMALIATVSPPLYALVGAYTAIAPLLALRLTGRTGTATVTALCCALIAWPFSTLGVLLLAALIAPALAMDLLFSLRGRIGARTALWSGAGLAAIVIFTLSLPVFSPEHLTPSVLVLTLVARLVSYAVACWLSGLVALALERAGVRRFTRRAPQD